jgi:hypothetical protein
LNGNAGAENGPVSCRQRHPLVVVENRNTSHWELNR